MTTCAVCGKPVAGGIGMGGVIICRSCDPIVREEMDRLRAANKSVNVSSIAKKIYKEQFAGSDYLLKDPPDDLMRQVKAKAAMEGVTIKDAIIKSLRQYVST